MLVAFVSSHDLQGNSRGWISQPCHSPVRQPGKAYLHPLICTLPGSQTPSLSTKYSPVSGPLSMALALAWILTFPKGLLQPLRSFSLQNQADGLASEVGLDLIPSSDLGKSPTLGPCPVPPLVMPLLMVWPKRCAHWKLAPNLDNGLNTWDPKTPHPNVPRPTS